MADRNRRNQPDSTKGGQGSNGGNERSQGKPARHYANLRSQPGVVKETVAAKEAMPKGEKEAAINEDLSLKHSHL